MNTQRFNFSGFELIRQQDTKSHEVEVGKVRVGDALFIVHMIRKAGLSFHGSFLVAKVYNSTEEAVIWEFPRNTFQGLGLLAHAGDEIVIALVSKGRDGKVEKVLPFSSFTECQPLSLRLKIELKKLAAEFLGRGYNLTTFEREVAQKDEEKRKEAELRDREAAKDARQQARIEKVKQLMARGQVEAYMADGRKRFGLPVLNDEWQSLSHNTFVVLVESYNAENGQMGAPIEAFQIIKERGKNPKKGFSAPVTWKKPLTNQSATESIPQPIGTMVIELKNEPFEVDIYDTMDDIRRARTGGLNSGTYVTARDKRTGERFEIFSVHAKGMDTLGLYSSIG